MPCSADLALVRVLDVGDDVPRIADFVARGDPCKSESPPKVVLVSRLGLLRPRWAFAGAEWRATMAPATEAMDRTDTFIVSMIIEGWLLCRRPDEKLGNLCRRESGIRQSMWFMICAR